MHFVETVILASKSEIRAKVLESLSLSFTAEPSKVDESKILGTSPSERALKRAAAKAEALAKKSSLALIIGCDQVLSFEGEVFSKPKSEEEAFSHIKSFQGKAHTLLSAVSLQYASEDENFELGSFLCPVEMRMKALSDEEISNYVKTAEWKGCVGGYRIEGEGQKLFHPFPENLDPTIIMGLPLRKLKEKLQTLGCDFSSEKKLPFSLKCLSV